ncbi:Hypothetical predicted protein [Pelobates cultripes]|uniref:Uncharacterized protein n=1 Tax=Pelobates cultripes TaxID=61616 RepID=A0AAD1VR16_PELCU|nr:Hypothetical predicted protein [Pelobates cultripes]
MGKSFVKAKMMSAHTFKVTTQRTESTYLNTSDYHSNPEAVVPHQKHTYQYRSLLYPVSHNPPFKPGKSGATSKGYQTTPYLALPSLVDGKGIKTLDTLLPDRTHTHTPTKIPMQSTHPLSATGTLYTKRQPCHHSSKPHAPRTPLKQKQVSTLYPIFQNTTTAIHKDEIRLGN